MKIRTILIDDEPLVRTSLLRALRHDKDIDVVGECGDGLSALDAIHRENPHLICISLKFDFFLGA